MLSFILFISISIWLKKFDIMQIKYVGPDRKNALLEDEDMSMLFIAIVAFFYLSCSIYLIRIGSFWV